MKRLKLKIKLFKMYAGLQMIKADWSRGRVEEYHYKFFCKFFAFKIIKLKRELYGNK
jgi:hypothetical protein